MISPLHHRPTWLDSTLLAAACPSPSALRRRGEYTLPNKKTLNCCAAYYEKSLGPNSRIREKLLYQDSLHDNGGALGLFVVFRIIFGGILRCFQRVNCPSRDNDPQASARLTISQFRFVAWKIGYRTEGKFNLSVVAFLHFFFPRIFFLFFFMEKERQKKIAWIDIGWKVPLATEIFFFLFFWCFFFLGVDD